MDKWLSKRYPVYVFDIDGVLVDVRDKIAAALKALNFSSVKSLNYVEKQKFWKLFLSEEYIAYDKPRRIGIELLKDRLPRGKVVVFSGRPEKLKNKTIEELARWGVPTSSVIFYFRRKGDRRRDVDYKIGIVRRLRDIVEVHEDVEEVLKAIGKLYPNAKLYLHYDDEYKIYKI